MGETFEPYDGAFYGSILCWILGILVWSWPLPRYRFWTYIATVSIMQIFLGLVTFYTDSIHGGINAADNQPHNYPFWIYARYAVLAWIVIQVFMWTVIGVEQLWWWKLSAFPILSAIFYPIMVYRSNTYITHAVFFPVIITFILIGTLVDEFFQERLSLKRKQKFCLLLFLTLLTAICYMPFSGKIGTFYSYGITSFLLLFWFEFWIQSRQTYMQLLCSFPNFSNPPRNVPANIENRDNIDQENSQENQENRLDIVVQASDNPHLQS